MATVKHSTQLNQSPPQDRGGGTAARWVRMHLLIRQHPDKLQFIAGNRLRFSSLTRAKHGFHREAISSTLWIYSALADLVVDAIY